MALASDARGTEGRVIAVQYRVGGANRHGAAFVPDGVHKPPLLLLLDPAGAAGQIVERWRQGAAQRGWALAASDHVGNGTSDESDRVEVLALRTHMSTRWNTDAARTFVGGFSGGGCGAYGLALREPHWLRGAIVENGHLGPWRQHGHLARSDTSFYLFTRSADFNRDATEALARALRSAGSRVAFVERPGGHEPLGAGETVDALAWLEAAPAN